LPNLEAIAKQTNSRRKTIYKLCIISVHSVWKDVIGWRNGVERWEKMRGREEETERKWKRRSFTTTFQVLSAPY